MVGNFFTKKGGWGNYYVFHVTDLKTALEIMIRAKKRGQKRVFRGFRGAQLTDNIHIYNIYIQYAL